MRNKRYIIASTCTILSLISCQFSTTQKNTDSEEIRDGEEQKEEPVFVADTDYTEFTRVRIVDRQGFSNYAEACSMLLPKGWKCDGQIIWTAPGQACAGTNLSVHTQSPNGDSSFDILPNFTWGWSADPQVNAFNQQHGSGRFCSTGQPLDAEQFVRQIWASELGNPEISDLKVSQDAIASMHLEDDKRRMEMMRYGSAGVEFRHTAITARAKLPNGKWGILFCKVTNAANYVPNKYTGSINVDYMSAASRMIYVFPESEMKNAEQLMSVVVTGMRTNPAWKQAVDGYWRDVREKNHIAHIGTIRMMDEQTKQIAEQTIAKGNQRLIYMDSQMRNWEARQSTNDKIHNDFIKTIRGVENYRDATGTVELSSGYNHAWSRGDGSSFIMTDNSNFDPSSVFRDQQWQEMRKVD